MLFVNDPLMLPVPLAGIPVRFAVLFRVQVNTVPARLFDVEKLIDIAAPLQRDCVAGAATITGDGCTIISDVIALEAQPPTVAVTVNITVWSIPVEFTGVPEITVPLPELGIPVTAGLFRVQLITVPEIAFGFESVIPVIAVEPQMVCVNGETATVG